MKRYIAAAMAALAIAAPSAMAIPNHSTPAGLKVICAPGVYTTAYAFYLNDYLTTGNLESWTRVVWLYTLRDLGICKGSV